MRLNSNSLFRNIFLLMALISSLLLTACGGGGGGGGGGDGLREALVGTWYLNFEDGKPVVPNAKGEVDTMILKSDGSCLITDYVWSAKNQTYWEVGASEGTDKGTWSYADGRLYIKIDGEENSVSVSLDNGKLTITGTYEDSTDTWTSVYKKTKYGDDENSGGGSSQPVSPTNPTSITKNDLVGTWYLNYEDGYAVIPNSKGEVDTFILKSDGSFTIKAYDFEMYNGYWEVVGTINTITGKWSYSNGKLKLIINGETVTMDVNIGKDGSLTTIETYENPHETITSVYKKTKYGQ